MKITLVELSPTLNGRLFEKPAEDFYSLFKLPSRAIPLLDAILRREGYSDIVQINPAFNKTKMITNEEIKRLIESDVVGLSSITRTTPQSYELARYIKDRNPNVKIIMGGTHVSMLPDEALNNHCDIIVRQEGDITLPEVVRRIQDNPYDPMLDDVAGISFRKGANGNNGNNGNKSNKGDKADEVYHNPDRTFLTNEELSALPIPNIREIELKKGNVIPIITSRGCPYKCEYCTVIKNFGTQFRYLDEDSVIALFEYAKNNYAKKIFVADDSFAANKNRTKRLLHKIIERDMKLPNWSAQVRVESAFDDELLSLLRKANCTMVYIGLESFNDATLKLFKKKSNKEKNMEAVRRYHKHDICVHGMFILGAETDDLQSIRSTLDYAKKLKINTAQFFVLTPLPGTPLTKRYEEEGRILTKAWHKYDIQRVVIDHPTIDAEVLQREVDELSLKFYSYPQAIKALFTGNDKAFDFTMRILGRFLARKITFKNNKSHYQFLKVIDDWKHNQRDLFDQWKADINSCFDSETEFKEEEYQNKVKQIISYLDNVNKILSNTDVYLYSTYNDIKDYVQYTISKFKEEANLFIEQLQLQQQPQPELEA